MKYYTGIGSRETPQEICELMSMVAVKLWKKGYKLRSGGADGADMAFQKGMEKAKGEGEIYIAWEGFSGLRSSQPNIICVKDEKILERAEEIASQIHPAWERCSKGARMLHTRNIFQVLGAELNKPSKFLICYAEPEGSEGKVKGGTNTAVQLAIQNKVEVLNLYYPEVVERLQKFLEK